MIEFIKKLFGRKDEPVIQPAPELPLETNLQVVLLVRNRALRMFSLECPAPPKEFGSADDISFDIDDFPPREGDFIVVVTPDVNRIAIYGDETPHPVPLLELRVLYSALKQAWVRHRCLARKRFPMMMLDRNCGEFHPQWHIEGKEIFLQASEP